MTGALGVVLAGSCLLVACDSGQATGGASGGHEGKLTSNGLLLDLDMLGALSTAPLGTWRSELEVELDVAEFAALVAGESGLEHLEYLASCALDRGRVLVVPTANGELRFPGTYALAEEWVSEACGDSCQRWVTACLLAHANAYPLSVPISLRGEHPGMVWDEAIEGAYPTQEAAFYGNLFELTSPETPTLYACLGDSLLPDRSDDLRAIEEAEEYLSRRICAVGRVCPLENTGVCNTARRSSLTWVGSSCAQDAGAAGYFGDCLTEAPIVPGADPARIAEVITVYLE